MKTRIYLSLVIALLMMSSSVRAVGIGDIAPDFTVTDIHGNKHRLYDYLEDGKFVLIDFFFTTCGPCQYYAPQVNLAYEKYGCNTGDVTFISIDVDDNTEKVTAYDEEYQIKFPTVSGLDGGGNNVVAQYKVNSFPTFYLINSAKKIVDDITPPTLTVFNSRFAMQNIVQKNCGASTTDVEAETTEGDIRIYPNPAYLETVFIDASSMHNENKQVRLLDVMGREVKKVLVENTASKTCNLSLHGVPAGVYVVELQDTKGNIRLSKLTVL